MAEKKYDLEERLLNYAARIIRFVETLPKTRAGNHVGGQLLRSGTSPLLNHGEAQAAESSKDFVHKIENMFKGVEGVAPMFTLNSTRSSYQTNLKTR